MPHWLKPLPASLQALYLLLVTNKGSNILEDLEILRLLAKTVPDYVQTLSEEGIVDAAFDLLFAFDEVISLGYKENVTLQQVPVRRPTLQLNPELTDGGHCTSHPCCLHAAC